MILSNNKKSFTLIETLVTVAISTVVFAGIYSTYIVGNRAWVHYNDAIAARREARRALLGMVTELRSAQNVRVVQGPDGSAVHFYDPSEGLVSFIWSRKGADADKLIRRGRFDKRVLAQYISALSLQHLEDSVVIQITAGKPGAKGSEDRAVLKERVALRGKTAFFK